MFEHRNTHIYLIIRTKENTCSNVVRDLTPVHVIPETLSYPLQTNLGENKIIIKLLQISSHNLSVLSPNFSILMPFSYNIPLLTKIKGTKEAKNPFFFLQKHSFKIFSLSSAIPHTLLLFISYLFIYIVPEYMATVEVEA